MSQSPAVAQPQGQGAPARALGQLGRLPLTQLYHHVLLWGSMEEEVSLVGLPDLGVGGATTTSTQNVTCNSETLVGVQHLRPAASRPCPASVLSAPRLLFLHPQPIIYLIISLLSGLGRESSFLCYK